MLTTIENKLRVAHIKSDSKVAYLGFGIQVGSSDEDPEEYGISHFIEHMLFKGTDGRSNYQVISQLEDFGGELNAYTTKEETFIYTAFPKQHMECAMELIADIVFNSTFPEDEMEKEKDVVLDEINSYKDNPAEVIFDEFEEQIFEGHPFAHNILGTEETVKSFTRDSIFKFIKKNYSTEKMVLFTMGDYSDDEIVDFSKKYFSSDKYNVEAPINRQEVTYTPSTKKVKEDTYQAHSILGTPAYSMFDKRRLTLQLLCNLLGGPAMNTRLNYELRERNGIGYNIETHYSAYSNSGIVYIYWGSDENNVEKSNYIIIRELHKLIESPLVEEELMRVKQQYLGQLMLAYEQRENRFLNLGKSIMYFNGFKTMEEVVEKINAITADEIQEVAKDIFEPSGLSSLLLV